MKTQFYQRLTIPGATDRVDYHGVQRWTKNIDVFAADFVFVPVHEGLHWVMVMVSCARKVMVSYDSLGGPGKLHRSRVKAWLQQESLNKKQEEFDWSGWRDYAADCPQQGNRDDCGIFMCCFIRALSTGRATDDVVQTHMPIYRALAACELAQGQVLTPSDDGIGLLGAIRQRLAPSSDDGKGRKRSMPSPGDSSNGGEQKKGRFSRKRSMPSSDDGSNGARKLRRSSRKR